MKFLKHAIVAVAILAASTVAQAELLLEPYAGYGFGSYEGGNNTITTPMLGARVGYAGTLIDVAFDYSTAVAGTYKSGSSSSDYTNSTIGAIVGVGLPLVHLWAGYGFVHKAKQGSTEAEGTQIKGGIGFRGIPLISLNLEYMMNTYKKVNGTDLQSSTSGNIILISIGIPL